MKVLQYGTFLKKRTQAYDDYWDTMPIGMRAATMKAMRENAETAESKYFWRDKDGNTYIVTKPRFFEKVIAMFNKSKLKVAGYLSESTVVNTTDEIENN